jgi:3-phosphoshikimate 1-carboxyvinyltransferase
MTCQLKFVNKILHNFAFFVRKRYNANMDIKITPKTNINGKITVPGDKSISHRALILGAIAEGVTEIEGFLPGEDCLATIDCLGKLGVKIEQSGDVARVFGVGLYGLQKPAETLYVGNSGTTLRLLTGLLAGQNFDCVLDGDASIRRRPMDRVIRPLSQMGAKISGSHAPISIKGAKLRGIHYKMSINSAQVKSAILLAALYGQGETLGEELSYGTTRAHTEKMMAHMGICLDISGKIIRYAGGAPGARKISVPGDISSAAFFFGLGVLMAKDGLMIENVGINPTRTGLIDALRQMGAKIAIDNRKMLGPEETGDIFVKKSALKAIELKGDIVPRMIDEIPIFAVAALFARGTTVIRDAEELALKESNRILAMWSQLAEMGAKIEARHDGMIIHGDAVLNGAVADSHGDHRVAMALAIAATVARAETTIRNTGCIDISFPNFFQILDSF